MQDGSHYPPEKPTKCKSEITLIELDLSASGTLGQPLKIGKVVVRKRDSPLDSSLPFQRASGYSADKLAVHSQSSSSLGHSRNLTPLKQGLT